MSDSIFNVNPVTGVSSYYYRTNETVGSKAAILSTLVYVMKCLNKAAGWKYPTNYDLARAAYDEVAAKGWFMLERKFPSKEAAYQEMVSEYIKRK